MGPILQRFDDPGTERAFLRAERRERGQAIRALIVIAALTLLSYIVINPMHFPRDGVIAYTWAAGALILLMAGFWLLSRSQFYLDRPWVDLPVFVAIAGAMKWLALVLAGLAAFTGFPPHVMAMVQMGILLVFASVGFAGTFRLFLGWALAVLAIFAAWLMTRPGISDISRVYTLTNFSTFFVFALYFNWDIERRARKVFAATMALEAERAKTEELLYNVLPQEVAARLRAGEAVADSFSDLTAIFVDLAGFSTLAKKLSPGHLVKLLNTFFSAADRCAERHGLEKVKTIGDAYLAVLGGTSSRESARGGGGGKAAILFARDLVAELVAMEKESGIVIKARIGVHSGPAVGGVIGTTRLAYDYWGDTMNVASRLQAVAPLNGIAVSEATYFQTMAIQDYDAHKVVLKGIGETAAYAARLDARGGGLTMGKVTGLGGIFYKVADPARTQAWYKENLGIGGDWGANFRWADETGEDPFSLLSPFKESTDYMAPSDAPFMINLRVDDLDAMIADLEGKGIEVLGRQDEDYGNFAWILDCDGIKVELWQQKGPAPA